jgi:hypothetical protein
MRTDRRHLSSLTYQFLAVVAPDAEGWFDIYCLYGGISQIVARVNGEKRAELVRDALSEEANERVSDDKLATPPSSLNASPRRGVVWGRVTPDGLRAFGIDFGPFAVVILLDAAKPPKGGPEPWEESYDA